MTPSVGYIAPATLKDVLARLDSLGSRATVLAGGQDVAPLMNQGTFAPKAIVDLKRIKGLSGIARRNGSIAVGAGTTHREIERSGVLQEANGLLVDAAGQIGGGMQVRNRGTIGGAICAGNPAYDYAPCLVALDAAVRARSSKGSRKIPAAAFFRNAGVTGLEPQELVTEIIVPSLPKGSGSAYYKLKFTEGCYNIASAACVVQLDGDGKAGMVRMALGGVSPAPIRLSGVEDAVTGSALSDELLAVVSSVAQKSVTRPISDVQADGRYRRAMAGVVATRALTEAFEKARKASV